MKFRCIYININAYIYKYTLIQIYNLYMFVVSPTMFFSCNNPTARVVMIDHKLPGICHRAGPTVGPSIF